MKVLSSWLQNHIKEKIPHARTLADLFTFHAFEVEGVEIVGDDESGPYVLDVKILPDRAHYALSHKGIAREIAAITGLTLKHIPWAHVPVTLEKELVVKIHEPKIVRRYMVRRIENLSIRQSPDWMALSLQVIGQRSINNVVDATNVVMFDIGQPMHAFDADKVVGTLTVRFAKPEEKITTLDNKEINLEASMLIIADDAGPLAIAGVKGGNRAIVTESTKNIIVESANFDPVSVRKTSTAVGIRNDSSKRFENEISPTLAEEGMNQLCAVLKELNPHAHFGEIVDIYPAPVSPWQITVTPEYISQLLGIEIPEKEIVEIMRRMEIVSTKEGDALILAIPYWRFDLTIPRDIVEEVGRIYGYEKIHAMSLPALEKYSINKTFYWQEKIKNILLQKGYTEVFTYALTNVGEIEIQNPLASDKGFLRAKLYEGIETALAFNSRNAALLGQEEIKIFEIGNVFKAGEQEELHLALGYFSTKNIKSKEKLSWEYVEKEIKDINQALSLLSPEKEIAGVLESSDAGIVFETNIDTLIQHLPEPTEWDIVASQEIIKKYIPFSLYPFATRDIAVFVPEAIGEENIEKIIIEKSGNLLARKTLFDVFTKTFPDSTKKTSYAFRLVFQSHEKTLTEIEINEIMSAITDTMNGREGWQVR
jgi:phenylalanyl-tRNA synthetase beta chain